MNFEIFRYDYFFEKKKQFLLKTVILKETAMESYSHKTSSLVAL